MVVLDGAPCREALQHYRGVRSQGIDELIASSYGSEMEKQAALTDIRDILRTYREANSREPNYIELDLYRQELAAKLD